MKLKKGFVVRCVAGDPVLMPVDEMVDRFDGWIVLNDLAAFLIAHISPEAMPEAGFSPIADPPSVTRDDLLDAILATYDTDRDRAAADLDAFLDLLRSYEILEES